MKKGKMRHVSSLKPITHPAAPPGLIVKSDAWAFEYKGAAESLVAAGLANPEWLPGQAGCPNLTSFAVEIDGRHAEFRRNASGSYVASFRLTADERATVKANAEQAIREQAARNAARAQSGPRLAPATCCALPQQDPGEFGRPAIPHARTIVAEFRAEAIKWAKHAGCLIESITHPKDRTQPRYDDDTYDELGEHVHAIITILETALVISPQPMTQPPRQARKRAPRKQDPLFEAFMHDVLHIKRKRRPKGFVRPTSRD